MLQGHDTTASGIFWTLYLLGRHPDILRKAQDEVDDVWSMLISYRIASFIYFLL